MTVGELKALLVQHSDDAIVRIFDPITDDYELLGQYTTLLITEPENKDGDDSPSGT